MARTSRSMGVLGCLAVTLAAVLAAGQPAGAAPDGAVSAPPAAVAYPAACATAAVAAPNGVWSATLSLRGSRNLDSVYAILTPTVEDRPVPRLSVRSRPETPVFTLDVRRSISIVPTYIGVLRYSYGPDLVGIARVVGTWSERLGRYWGGWVAAGGHRGTVVVELTRNVC